MTDLLLIAAIAIITDLAVHVWRLRRDVASLRTLLDLAHDTRRELRRDLVATKAERDRLVANYAALSYHYDRLAESGFAAAWQMALRNEREQ